MSSGSSNIIGLEYCHSDNMPLDQSAATDCRMHSLHLDLERSTMPLDQWVLSVFWQGKAFLPCKFKGQFKMLVNKKCTKSVFCLGDICVS